MAMDIVDTEMNALRGEVEKTITVLGSASKLSRAAHVSESVLSRFINGGPLELENYLKLVRWVKGALPVSGTAA